MSSKFSFVFLIMTWLLIMGVFACNDSDCFPENDDEVAIYNAKYKPAEFEKAKNDSCRGLWKSNGCFGTGPNYVFS